MATKINGVSTGALHSANTKPSVTDKTAREPGKSPAAGGESTTVSLTSDAVLLGKLDQALAAVPEIDQARVDSIKQAIASGQYEIDADKIASALLKFDRDLGEI